MDADSPSVPDPITFIVMQGRSPLELTLPPTATILELRKHIEEKLQVPPPMQKLIFKGILKDNATLESSNIKNGTKVILMASKMEDVINVVSSTAEVTSEEPAVVKRVPLSSSTEHQKIISKGLPEDIEPGILNKTSPLPIGKSIKGLVNQANQRANLTFKDGLEQVWIGTKERTQKISFSSVRSIISEPILGQEEYHLLALQLGPTERSRYWLYWVPAQYIETIKDNILGSFGYF